MQPAQRITVTDAEYIERERRSETKHELVNGMIVAMAGASPRHNAIAANVIGALGAALRRGPCVVLTSDQRVHVEDTGLYTYPDVAVVCDEPRFHPKDRDTLLNPRVVVEVLSASTESHDRGAKFAHYRSIPSLQEYVLVVQHEPRVEHYRRLETGQWLLTESKGPDAVVMFPSLGIEVPLSEIYDKVERFEADPTPEPPRAS
jgi:Uma2 family endonuclease